jgi:hypothetical protein
MSDTRFCEELFQIYAGEKWMENEPRILLPATVLRVDSNFVYLQRDRKTRVRLDRFLKRFRKVSDAPSLSGVAPK